jgi:hypothetical protein
MAANPLIPTDAEIDNHANKFNNVLVVSNYNPTSYMTAYYNQYATLEKMKRAQLIEVGRTYYSSLQCRRAFADFQMDINNIPFSNEELYLFIFHLQEIQKKEELNTTTDNSYINNYRLNSLSHIEYFKKKSRYDILLFGEMMFKQTQFYHLFNSTDNYCTFSSIRDNAILQSVLVLFELVNREYADRERMLKLREKAKPESFKLIY